MQPNKADDFGEVLDQERYDRPGDRADKRVENLEATVFRLFGFLLGALVTHIFVHL